MRAAIRAKVTAAKLADATDDRQARIEKNATDYFALAIRLIAPPKPMLVAVGGLSGTGKSVLARMLAPDICTDRRAQSCFGRTRCARRCSAVPRLKNCRPRPIHPP